MNAEIDLKNTSEDFKEGGHKKIRLNKVRYFDYGLLVIVVLLITFGLVMLYSTSSYEAGLQFGDPAHYLKRQLFAVVVGLIAMSFLIIVRYRFILPLSGLLYMIATVACLLVIFMGVAQGTSSRWFYFGGLSVQPSEVAKVAVIIFLAAKISKNKDKLNDWRYIGKLFVTILPILIFVGYNNLSTAVIIFGIAFVMLFIAGRPFLMYFGVAGLGLLFIATFIMFWGYRSERFAIWRDPESYENGYQVMQGLYAIGSGGLFGKGLGESFQKMGYVPEAQNDMIFSIVCEELGVVGAICVIVMYILLLWRCLIVALNVKDTFGSYLVIGVMAHIAIQVILNIAVVTNTIPNTGVTLPFISYGGTSMSILVAEMGLVLSVSRGIALE